MLQDCLLQATFRFPWEFIDVINDLLLKLEYISECLSTGKVPQISHSSYSNHTHILNKLGKQPWKAHLPSIAKPTFQHIPVICTDQFDNRSLRNWFTKRSTPVKK